MKLYVEKGIAPGGFLTALLENDLVESFSRADNINQDCMLEWVKFLYNELPSGCWGSKEVVKDWIKTKSEEAINARK